MYTTAMARTTPSKKTCLQLFRERLSYKRRKAYAIMSNVIMENGSFYGCLIEPQGVSAWWRKTAQTRVFVLSRSLLLNRLEPQSRKAKLLLPIMPIDIVAYFCGTTFVETAVYFTLEFRIYLELCSLSVGIKTCTC